MSVQASLNPAQQQAVEHLRGPLLVLAGAGSGKTRVLTMKIARFLELDALAGEILAVTFTNKAAKEMRERVGKLVGPENVGGLWIGTFHSICGRLLRRDIDRYQTPGGRRWDRNFVIYDEDQSIAAVKEAVRGLNLDEKLYIPKTLRYKISDLKGRMLDAYTVATRAKTFQDERLASVYDAYEATLSKNNALDFDDLLMLAVRLLQQQPEILERYHRQFRHVLVDEFQDTNEAQYELVRLIVEGSAQRSEPADADHWARRSVTVVGDVDQSIYSWRGANFRILLNFQSDFPTCQLIKLEENYRSTAGILKVADKIIGNNAERLPKTFIAVRGDGHPVTVYEAKDDRDEAQTIIDQLQRWARETTSPEGRPYTLGDACVLYRTNAQSRVLEDVLMSRGIPYQIIGGLKFYDRKEIKDLKAYLTLLFNPHEADSLRRVLNVPTRGIGKTTLERLNEAANERNLRLFELLRQADTVPGLTPKVTRAIGGFVALIDALRAQVGDMTFEDDRPGTLAPVALDQLLQDLVIQSGYAEMLKTEDPEDSEGRLGNVEEFIRVARQFQQEFPGAGLPEFLTQMALLSDLDSAEPAENKLVMMTLHAAKGLEFPLVAIAGLEEGIFPHGRSLENKEALEEERRLMYVGVTRAADRLLMTYARRRMMINDIRYNAPSRFLLEAPPELLTGSHGLGNAPKTRTLSATDLAELPPRQSGRGGSRGPANRPAGYSASANRGPSTAYGAGAKGNKQERIVLSQPLSPAPRTEAPPSAAAPVVCDFAPGDRVAHHQFGQGAVSEVIGSGKRVMVSVVFDGIPGKKLLDPRFAKLQKAD